MNPSTFTTLVGELLVIAVTIALAGYVGWRQWRRAMRRGEHSTHIFRGLCPACGYDLTSREASLNCPECGHTLSKDDRRRLSNIAPALARAREEDAARRRNDAAHTARRRR